MNKSSSADSGAGSGTDDLKETNARLQTEILKYKQAELSLRRSEAYLAEVERLSHTGGWAYDVATGVPVYWSLERCRISKFDPAKGHPTWEEYRKLHTAEDWEKLIEAYRHAIRHKIDFETDAREVLADGTVKYLHIVGHPVLNVDGDVVELVGSTIDVTERKLTEDALQKAQSHLNQMTHLTMMGELAASIAHEVNQPLAAVVTNANACLRWLDRDPPHFHEAREAVSRIIRDGIRGGDVIVRIRALLRKEPQAAKMLNINEVIREILALSQTHLRGVRVQFDSAENLAAVHGDRIQIEQVLLNLITNAADAMKTIADRQKVFRIQTKMASPQTVLVQVKDSGIGLHGSDIESLFEPFYTTKPNGAGMGLSISRSIIDAHGGRLWAEPGEEFGAVFRFTLPAESQTQ